MNMVFNRIFDCDFHWTISRYVLTAMYLSKLWWIHHKLHWRVCRILKAMSKNVLWSNIYIEGETIVIFKNWTKSIIYLRWTEVLSDLSTVTSTSLSVPLFTLTCKAQFTASVISTETYQNEILIIRKLGIRNNLIPKSRIIHIIFVSRQTNLAIFSDIKWYMYTRIIWPGLYYFDVTPCWDVMSNMDCIALGLILIDVN